MKERAWWQRGVIYQVYPRSFQDSNGDGVGDLKGISLRLEHLVDLGIDAIWISPIFPSPMRDFGYDVSDYRAPSTRCSAPSLTSMSCLSPRTRETSRLFLISCPTILRMSIPGFGRAALRSSTRSGTGMCGETQNRTVRLPTTGRVSLAVRPGPSTKSPVSTITTHT